MGKENRMKRLDELTDADEVCKNCRFFEALPVQKRNDNVLGACKANPPFPSNNENNPLGVWPLTLATFWCGIFEDKKK